MTSFVHQLKQRILHVLHVLMLMVATLPRDARSLWFLIKARWTMWRMQQLKTTIADVFQQTVNRYPTKTAIVFEEVEWTYEELDQDSNRIANWLLAHDFKKGDVIALLMENRPEFISFWMGCAKIGVITALINNNLHRQPLLHSIKICNAKLLFFGRELSRSVVEILDDLPDTTLISCRGHGKGPLHHAPLDDALRTRALAIDDDLSRTSASTPPRPLNIGFNSPLFYVFTSGTTGLPKAAMVKHDRYFYMSFSIGTMFHVNACDRVYCTLPLYHSAGGVLGVGMCLQTGATLVLRRKFSASKFWEDCRKYHCTVVQYIGDLCRFLLAQPPQPNDGDHNIRIAIGNGLRENVWRDFVKRFSVPQMGEFYGATEGNANLVNTENVAGACGFNSIILPFVYPVRLLQYDNQTETLVRDPRTGLCIPCQPGDIGELVGRIKDNDPLRKYDGYVGNEDATKSKVVRDVFVKGDAYFRTGDLLTSDERGYVYFRDRIGDTFRWRGENVSTVEVERVGQAGLPECYSCVVYGVEIPKEEGRAGMCAIVCDNESRAVSLNLHEFRRHLERELPPYARPVFVRVMTTPPEMTGTFKVKKADLKLDGWNVEHGFVFSSQTNNYVAITAEVKKAIESGSYRY